MSLCMKASKVVSESDDLESMIASSSVFLGVMDKVFRKQDIGFMGSERSIGNMDGWLWDDAPTVGSGGLGGV